MLAMRKRSFFITGIVFLILALLITAHVSIVLKTYIVDDANNIRTLYSGYGDIPLHLTQVNKFARTDLNDLDEPIYYGSKLQSPFATNFISGLLQRISGWERFSFLAPIVALAIANILLAYWIFKRLIGQKIFAAFAVTLFLLGGGFGAIQPIKEALNNNRGISEFV